MKRHGFFTCQTSQERSLDLDILMMAMSLLQIVLINFIKRHFSPRATFTRNVHYQDWRVLHAETAFYRNPHALIPCRLTCHTLQICMFGNSNP